MSISEARLSLADVLLASLYLVKKKHGQDTIFGRTTLQKAYFIACTELGVRESLGLNFRSYLHGPYSSPLHETLSSLVAFGQIEEIPRPMIDFMRYDYRLSDDGERAAKSVVDQLKGQKRGLVENIATRLHKLSELTLRDLVDLAYSVAEKQPVP